jgi:hypothetical protein
VAQSIEMGEENMTEINGERVLWFNNYLSLAITEKDCERCGGDLTIYGTAKEVKPLLSMCNAEWGEMLPTITEFVAKHKD